MINTASPGLRMKIQKWRDLADRLERQAQEDMARVGVLRSCANEAEFHLQADQERERLESAPDPVDCSCQEGDR